MFHHVKELQFNARVSRPDPQFYDGGSATRARPARQAAAQTAAPSDQPTKPTK